MFHRYNVSICRHRVWFCRLVSDRRDYFVARVLIVSGQPQQLEGQGVSVVVCTKDDRKLKSYVFRWEFPGLAFYGSHPVIHVARYSRAYILVAEIIYDAVERIFRFDISLW